MSIENSDLSKLQLYFMIKQKFIIKLFISPASWVVISTRRHSTVSKRDVSIIRCNVQCLFV